MSNDIPTHDIRRDFDINLYVEREAELAIAKEWLRSTRRVLTITSPPANGKTWFLTRLRNFLRDEEKQHTFQIDVSNFLADGSLGNRNIDHVKMQMWTETFVAELHQSCASIPSIEDTAETSSVLNKLAGHISAQCLPGQSIYLFIDGGDEPNPAAWKTIEKQILEPIIAHPNWQIIIALRQSQRLYSYLLRQAEQRCPLKPLPSPIRISQQGQDQLEKLISQSQEATPSLTEIIAMVPDYNWVHLGLNYFIFLEACYQSTGQQKPVENDLLKRGILALTSLHDVDEILKQLQSISQLPPEWAVEELAARLGQPLSAVWETIQTLQDHMLITNIDNSFQITPGVQEFVRSLTPIQLKIRIDKDINEFTGNEFISDLSSALKVDAERIKILVIEPGSVTVILKIPQNSFFTLLQMFIAQDSQLEKLRLLEIKPIMSYGVSLNEEIQHGLTTENKTRLSHQKFRQELRQLIEACFNLDELHILCFDLDIKCENFESGISLRIVRIIEHCERIDHLDSLLNYLRQKRPKITWPAINWGGFRYETVNGNR